MGTHHIVDEGSLAELSNKIGILNLKFLKQKEQVNASSSSKTIKSVSIRIPI